MKILRTIFVAVVAVLVFGSGLMTTHAATSPLYSVTSWIPADSADCTVHVRDGGGNYVAGYMSADYCIPKTIIATDLCSQVGYTTVVVQPTLATSWKQVLSSLQCSKPDLACTYTGPVGPWAPACSASGTWNTPSGSNATINNTAAGYTGSVVYSCSNGGYSWVSQSCTALPPTLSTSVSPSSIAYNSSATISWSSANTNSCYGYSVGSAGATWNTGGWNAIATSGSASTGVLSSTSSFYIYCAGKNGTNVFSSPYPMTVTVATPPMSGSLTIVPSPCIIGVYESSCHLDLSWIVTNPEGKSSFTSSNPIGLNYDGSADPASFYTVMPVVGEHNPTTFSLYNNSKLLTQTNVLVKCISGAAWDGGVCRPILVPTVTTPTVTSITTTGATLGANVTSLGNPATITARGTCWGTTANPTINCVAATGVTTGIFTHARASMTANTLYYYRGYADNSTGRGYSADGTFTTLVNSYTVSAPAVANGTISPASQTVSSGGSTTFTVTPNAGYTAAASGCGGSLSGTTYTTGAITGACTVSATYTLINVFPTPPTISGPTTLITGHSGEYSFVSTDPQGQQVTYAVDWNSDGTDLWMPYGSVPPPGGMTYVNSGVSQSASKSWSTPGTYTVRVLAQDYPGNNSAWTTYTVTVSDPQPCTAGVVDSSGSWAPTCSTSATCLTPPSPAQLTNQPGIQIGLCPTPEYTGNAYRSCSTATIICTLSTFCGDSTCNGSETLLTCPADCKARYQQF